MGSDLNQPWVREEYLNEQVRKLEKENAELKEQNAALDREVERWRQKEETRAMCCVDNELRARKTEAENAELRAKVTRYEAPGPALLYVECGDHNVVCASVDGPCICAEGRAYREQHARCVAVIAALVKDAELEYKYAGTLSEAQCCHEFEALKRALNALVRP